ncbi:MAG: ATP synthase F1 subunit gamma [Pirellulaceae bacterium]|jgi:F-type H+-transporting ATPase subunit gamma|nr:ATP synthase F1 subunit gamma [Pirellulaceae bacterium]
MANARKLDKRRKSIRNIRKITRTMELIATARFKKAMERAAAATDYTKRITEIVSDLAAAGLEVSHPLLEGRPEPRNVVMLVLTANRGLCGGYNGNALRLAAQRRTELVDQLQLATSVDVSGKRGISGLKFRKIPVEQTFTQFDDQPKYEQVEPIANAYLEKFIAGEIDRLDVVYTRFISVSRQEAVVETLLPLGKLGDDDSRKPKEKGGGESMYEFLPSAASILEEVVPTSFKVKLFKCFLDAAVSEQIARMVAMKNATKSASDMIKSLSLTYNRARQSQITGEIMEVIGGVEALKT